MGVQKYQSEYVRNDEIGSISFWITKSGAEPAAQLSTHPPDLRDHYAMPN
jgi:hypothetical protein